MKIVEMTPHAFVWLVTLFLSARCLAAEPILVDSDWLAGLSVPNTHAAFGR